MHDTNSIFTLISVVVSTAAIIAYLNYRWLHFPTTIAIMSGSLLISLLIIIFGKYGFSDLQHYVDEQVRQLDFNAVIIQGMLSYLLFAGALNVKLDSLKKSKWEITVLATVGTIVSTFMIGGACYILLPYIGFHLSLLNCLLFGALISPTDPIAVLAIFKKLGAPDILDTTVTGESLFNDGVGIVLFLVLYDFSQNTLSPTYHKIILLFLQQALGGIAMGLLFGFLSRHLLRNVKDIKIELLITLALVTGGYTLANSLGTSGPLAIVTTGIILGNRDFNIENTRALAEFWELIDEILNAILFFLIGIELVNIIKNGHYAWAAVSVIPIVLLTRYIIVAIPISFFKLKRHYPANFINILAWGGLRGGLAVALAFALPIDKNRDLILAMTYAVVVFSIIIQGSTIKPLLKTYENK